MVFYQKGATSYRIYKQYLWMKAGERKTSDHLQADLLEFMTDYCEMPIGIHNYHQIAIEIGQVFLGSEYEINMEQLDVLVVQVGHTLGMAQFKYAAEHGQLGSMSSDLLLRYGRISESWCEVAGFQPNKPPMLPLRTQARLRNSQYSTNVSAALPDNNNPAHFDPVALMQTMTATIIHKVQQIQFSLRDEIQKAIAQGLAEIQYNQQSGMHSSVPQSVEPHQDPFQQSTLLQDSFVQDPSLPDSFQQSPSLQDSSSQYPSLPDLFLPDLNDIYCSPKPESIPLQADTYISLPTASIANEIIGEDTNPTPHITSTSLQHLCNLSDKSKKYLLHLLKNHFPYIKNLQFKSAFQLEAVELAVEGK